MTGTSETQKKLQVAYETFKGNIEKQDGCESVRDCGTRLHEAVQSYLAGQDGTTSQNLKKELTDVMNFFDANTAVVNAAITGNTSTP